MKIATVVGARPQFIKAAPVSLELRGRHEEILVHTGQHYDYNMSEAFFAELELARPHYNLEVGSGPHGLQTGAMIIGVERVLLRERPDAVLIYGDTNSTVAGALAGAKLGIPVAHVEAGLRSYNRKMPEEINRVVADAVSDILFAPTENARCNLLKEGVADTRIHVVGDVMYDTALKLSETSGGSDIIERLRLDRGDYILATIHRAENTDAKERLQVIVEALDRVAQGERVLFPLHPRTKDALARMNLLNVGRQYRFELLEPLGYRDMARLERHAALIVTDSGGVQKEAFFHRVPCVTLRNETEWKELVDAGWNVVCVPTSVDAVVRCISERQAARGREIRPYGDGGAAARICSVLEAELNPPHAAGKPQRTCEVGS